MGGAGSGVNELLMAKRRPVPVLNLRPAGQLRLAGHPEELRAELGWTPPAFSGKSKLAGAVIATRA